jgi:hypothetical protein
MLTINRPHTIFNDKAAAEAAIIAMGFEDGETRINIDPKGSGRCFVEVLDLEDGAVIGRV